LDSKKEGKVFWEESSSSSSSMYNCDCCGAGVTFNSRKDRNIHWIADFSKN
jgi:hypothetical protein